MIILFHIALVIGAPWGEFTMGGQDRGVLPPKKRLLALLAIPLLLLNIVNVLSQAGIGFEEYKFVTDITIWLVLFLNALILVGNLVTRSPRERLIWAPIVTAMFICIAVIVF